MWSPAQGHPPREQTGFQVSHSCRIIDEGLAKGKMLERKRTCFEALKMTFCSDGIPEALRVAFAKEWKMSGLDQYHY